MPLSTIFQLYHGGKFLGVRKPEYLEKTTDLKAGSGDNYSNSQSTKHQGSNLKVTGDLNISADNIKVEVVGCCYIP
jgi:hypothetical protein